jgi:hypothetical protein
MATSFSGGRRWSTRREPQTMGKQLVNCITCGCESSASFIVIYKAVRESTPTDRSASYLDLHLEIDSEERLRTKRYDKTDDFNFPIVNFPFLCSNIPAAPAYGVYISRLIR